MEPVRWGILGTAKIAARMVIPGLRKSPLCDVRAIASRSLDKARAAAAEAGIPTAYGGYEDLLADPEIEAVYIPVPNHLHVELCLKAAEAGKHVLCEKPIALDAAEAERLRALDGRVLFHEAFMVRHHPQWHAVREMVRSGRIGAPRAMFATFAYRNLIETNIRNRRDCGGGALMDIGCYPICVSRYAFGTEPVRAVAAVERDPTFGTDRLTSGIVDFGEGRHLVFTAGTQQVPAQRVEIFGETGRIELPIPFTAPEDEAMRILLDDGSAKGGASATTIEIAACDHYEREVDTFARAVRGEVRLEFGVEDAIANMRVIDALFRSETSGRWEGV